MKATATVLVDPEALAGASVELVGEAFHHLFRVRRLASEERLRLVDGVGTARWGRAVRITADRATIELGASAPANEPAIAVELWVPPPRSRRAAWLVEKATELGVGAIRFVTTERAAREISAPALERLRRVAISALKQCHRARLPEISGPCSWESCLEALEGVKAQALAPGGGPLVADPRTPSQALLIGPEGGWSDAELRQLSGLGVATVGLGPRILRLETAAVVALAMALASS